MSYKAYVDGVQVEMPDAEQAEEYIAQLAKSLHNKSPNESTEAGESTTLEISNDTSIFTKTADTGSTTSTRPHNTRIHKQITAPDMTNTLPYRGKPPPATFI